LGLDHVLRQGDRGLPEKIYGNECRNTMVFVDSYEDRVPKGRYFNPSMPAQAEFCGVMELLIGLDSLMDRMDFPRAFNELRRFGEISYKAPDTEVTAGRGKAATFSLRVVYRQNSSWQGSLVWVDGKTEQAFRSVLELLMLMDSALSAVSEE